MTIPQALTALLVVLPIGIIGGWTRRFVTRTFRFEPTGWMALVSVSLMVVGAVAFYWSPPSHLTLNTAVALTLGSSLSSFLGLGAATFGQKGPIVLMGLLYCLLALPLIAFFTFGLFVMVWTGAHMNPPA